MEELSDSQEIKGDGDEVGLILNVMQKFGPVVSYLCDWTKGNEHVDLTFVEIGLVGHTVECCGSSLAVPNQRNLLKPTSLRDIIDHIRQVILPDLRQTEIPECFLTLFEIVHQVVWVFVQMSPRVFVSSLVAEPDIIPLM